MMIIPMIPVDARQINFMKHIAALDCDTFVETNSCTHNTNCLLDGIPHSGHRPQCDLCDSTFRSGGCDHFPFPTTGVRLRISSMCPPIIASISPDIFENDIEYKTSGMFYPITKLSRCLKERLTRIPGRINSFLMKSP